MNRRTFLQRSAAWAAALGILPSVKHPTPAEIDHWMRIASQLEARDALGRFTSKRWLPLQATFYHGGTPAGATHPALIQLLQGLNQ